MACAGRHTAAGSKIRFLEPAVGTGVFFSALADDPILVERLDSVLGLEIDPVYAKASQTLWKKQGFEIRQGDFIAFSGRSENRNSVNLICTNPPYVRHHHMPVPQKESLQARVRNELGIEVSGLAGLYVYFVLLAHAVLADGGVASWLIPSEFLVVNYGRALRDYLTTKVELISLHQFDPADVQFDDALVSSCVVTYRKKTPSHDSRFTFTHGGDLHAPRQTREIPVLGAELNGRWRLLPQEKITPVAARIGDLFTIKRGIATGANDFFLLTPEQVTALELPERFLRPVLPSPRFLNEPVIKADAAGVPRIPGTKYLLDCPEPPQTVRMRYPALWNYLEKGRAAGVAAGFLCANREPWYAQEQRAAAPYLASYMGRPTQRTDCPIRFFKNESRAIVTNVMLNLYPKPWLSHRLGEDPARGHELIALLNSISADSLVHGGRSYGGGLHKVEPTELANMPLPSLPAWAALPEENQLALL